MKKKRNKPYRPRALRLPILGPLRDEFAMHLHGALVSLTHRPSPEAWAALAQLFNAIQIAIRTDGRFEHEALLISSGARSLQQIERRAHAGMALNEHDLAPIRIGVTTIDRILGRLDVGSLERARIALEAMTYVEARC